MIRNFLAARPGIRLCTSGATGTLPAAQPGILLRACGATACLALLAALPAQADVYPSVPGERTYPLPPATRTYPLVSYPGGTGATSVTLTSNVASPQGETRPISFTAAGQGGTGAYEYEFALDGPATSNVMTVQQDYSIAAVWVWDTAGDVGSSTIRVRVRALASTGGHDAEATTGYTIMAPATGATLLGDPVSPVPDTQDVTFTGDGAGGTPPYEFEFALQGPATGEVMTAQQAYSTDTTWVWDTAGDGGNSSIRLRVRSQGSQFAVEAEDTLAYLVTERACTLDLTAPDGGGVHGRGDTVSVTWTGDPQVGTNVRIDLHKGGTFERTIEANTPDDQSYSWSVETDLTPATDYRLRVVDPFDATNCYGESASNFEIKAFITIDNPASLQVGY